MILFKFNNTERNRFQWKNSNKHISHKKVMGSFEDKTDYEDTE